MRCDAVRGEGVREGKGSGREQWCLLCSLPAFSHFPLYPQTNWALLVLIPGWVGLCTFWDPVGLSNELFCEVCLAPQLFLLVYLHVNVGPPGPPATVSPGVLSTHLPVSAPPTGLNECVFFNSLVVGLAYSSVFCQFWLFFVFKLLLSFF